LGGAVALEDFPGAAGDNTADEVDVIRLNEDREMSFATKSLLVERANKLADALERLRDGEYGLCEECEEPIAPARLRAMPEVTRCVRCQDRLERSRQFEHVGAGHDGDETEDD
jgi:DnaK suppressor protein